MTTREELEKRFLVSTVGWDRKCRPDWHEELSQSFFDVALYIHAYLADSREKSLALTDLESASNWAHKAMSDRVALTNVEEGKA